MQNDNNEVNPQIEVHWTMDVFFLDVARSVRFSSVFLVPVNYF